MKITKHLVLIFLLGLISACVSLNNNSTDQAIVNNIAQNLQINYKVTHNKWGQACSLPNGSKSPSDKPCYEAIINLQTSKNIMGGNWSIYYSQVEPIFAVDSDDFTIKHLNGDLHIITPTKNFSGFKAGEEKNIHIIVSGQVLTEAKLMPNYYVVAPKTKAKTIISTKLTTDPETGLIVRPYITPFNDIKNLFKKSKDDQTQLANGQYLYQTNAATNRNTAMSGIAGGIAGDNVTRDVISGIIPTPLFVKYESNGYKINISQGIKLYTDLPNDLLQTALDRLALLGMTEKNNGIAVHIKIIDTVNIDTVNTNKVVGSYNLDISHNKIAIKASDITGAYYGLMSLAALIHPDQKTIPAVKIKDAPLFNFRAMHIDVARNFHSKEEIIKIMDQMAAYKLNKLHLHLADDEGWRIAIADLKELTQIGSKRCHDPSENKCLLMQLGSGPTGTSKVDGFYSLQDYQQLLLAAKARHIEIIPAIDMPSHARAAIKAMQARYRKYLKLGNKVKAQQYLLSDPNDKSQYQSIQFYTDNTMNPCMESTFAFLNKVVTEIQKMHQQASTPLRRFHIGADETAGAWNASPICKIFYQNNKYGIKNHKQLTKYFLERIANNIAQHGIIPAAWNDGLELTDPKKMPSQLQSNLWGTLFWGGNKTTQKHANLAWDVVLSFPDVLYFDLPYEASPKEGGYYWASRHINTKKVFSFMPNNPPAHGEFWLDTNEKTFEINDLLQKDKNGKVTHTPLSPDRQYTGIQGHIWSETVPTDKELEYRIFPRLIALAERAWHQANWEIPYNYQGAIYNKNSHYFTKKKRMMYANDWEKFSNIIASKEMLKLDLAQIFYRIPTVGAVINDGVLQANIVFRGLTIEYREIKNTNTQGMNTQGMNTQGMNMQGMNTQNRQDRQHNLPTKIWQTYTKPVKVNNDIEIRARSASKKRAGRSLIIKYNSSEQ